MASAGNLGIKRVRPWESCDDVQELKRLLSDKDDEVADLQRKLKLAKEQTPAPSPAGGATPLPSKITKAQVSKVRTSIQSQILSQMTYNHSARDGEVKFNPVEVSDVTEPLLEALLGEKHFKLAPPPSGPQQVKVVLLNEDMDEVFNRKFSKKLRFGASLQLSYGLTFLFSKSQGSLTVSGGYKMVK